MRDADIEQAGLNSIGDTIAYLRKKGICPHAWRQGLRDKPGYDKCLDCGRVDLEATLDAERNELLYS